MRWVRRALWVGAWAIWAWIGVGLARELPREAVVVKSTLQLEEHERLCGRLNDGVVVTRIDAEYGAPSRYRTWETDGRLIHAWKGPLNDSHSSELPRLGFAAGIHTNGTESKSDSRPFQLLNLRTGAWTPLGSSNFLYANEHSTLPWFSVRETGGGEDNMYVYDVATKKRIFKWRRPNGDGDRDGQIGAVWFEGEVLAIVMQRELERQKEDDVERRELERQRLERWHVPTHSLVKTAAINPPGWIELPPGPSGRMLLRGRRGVSKSIAVVDARTLKTVFATDDPDEGDRDWEEQSARRIPEVKLSASGRMLLSDLGHLWNVDQNCVAWRPRKGSEAFWRYGGTSTDFCVHENWTPLLEKLHLPFKLATMAVRDLETGSVRYRTFDSAVEWWQILFKTSVPSDGFVASSTPPPPNYRVLVFCQTILALPLILLWLALRWRGTRRARQLAGAMA